MRGELRVLSHPTAEAGSSPTACLGSPEPRREEEEGSDGRDPPVSDPQREEGSSACVGRLGPRLNGPACGPSSWAARSIVLFPFSFYAKFVLCLILCRKLFADPKIMKIFV